MANNGIEDFKKALEALDKKLRNRVITQAMRAAAKVLANEIKSRAPVETGGTKKSVKVRAGKRKKDQISMRVEVSGGSGEAFVGFLELGTKHNAANPFVRNSTADKRDDCLDLMFSQITKAIEEKT